MMDKTAFASDVPYGRQGPQDMIRVFDAARRFVDLREKVAGAHARLNATPATLADAIDRDFLAFDLETAARDLRDAVIAIDPLLGILPLAMIATGAEAGTRQDN